MSSSEDDFYDASPEIVPRQMGRRKAVSNDTSPVKVPKKKQREVLSDFNVELEEEETSEEDSDEEESPPQRKGRRGKDNNNSRKSTLMEPPAIPLNRGSGSNQGVENRPPTSGVNIEVPDEDTQAVDRGSTASRPRERKRLSIRATDGERRRSGSFASAASVAESLATPTEVQNIYQTCSQMFNTNKINPQNAFNLRLLDCINQMINSPSYDKSNMQLTSSTVEIGTKIYVCRVENTHSQVLSLASDISLQQRRKKKGGDGDNEGMDQGDEFQDEDDGGGSGQKQKQKRKVSKKRGRFVEQDNAKLLTGLEEQNVKFVTRRNFLQKKCNEMIFDDMDFDYLSYFLEAEDVHPLQTEQEKEKLNSPLSIADGYANAAEMNRLDFLHFHHLVKFDPETYDIWGRPLNVTEDIRDHISVDPQLPINADFAYDPADRPAEYPDEAPPDDLMNGSFGDDPNHFDGEDRELQPAQFQDIRTLDGLDEYFQRVRSVLKDSKSKYGWCGPNFVRPKSTWPACRTGAKKAKVRKEPQEYEFQKLDWSDKANKFNVNNQSARTIFDDKIIESWSTQKVIIPFLGIELTSYDDEFDPLFFENENDEKYVPSIFKLFTSKNRSILDLLKAKRARERHLSDQSAAPSLGDAFDNDHEIELPRDLEEDFCPVNDDEFQPQASAPADTEAAWQFPSSLPGLLADDPMSLVSDIDSIRFSRKPKPIDMSILKKSILKTLMEKLDLSETGEPLKDEETKIDLAELMFFVLRRIGERTEKLMSVPIFIVALMHVVADKRLFVVYDDSDPDCPVVVCRGKKWKHVDHIPMPYDGFD